MSVEVDDVVQSTTHTVEMSVTIHCTPTRRVDYAVRENRLLNVKFKHLILNSDLSKLIKLVYFSFQMVTIATL